MQPLVARMVLPIFGGSPFVWSTCLLFFQSILVLGYYYAHLSSKQVGQRTMAWQLGILAGGLLFIPFRLNGSLLEAYSRAQGASSNSLVAQPNIVLLLLLFVSIAVPYFALSTGAPTLQHWYRFSDQPDRENPYFLYRASNIGSLSALLSYPFFVEPQFSLSEARVGWAVAYVFNAGLIGWCFYTIKNRRSADTRVEAAKLDPAAAPTRRQKCIWMALAAGPSCLLLGANSHLTTNIAPIPLLWVVPLSLYLLSFIIAFSDRFKPRIDNMQSIVGLSTLALLAALTLLSYNKALPLVLGMHFFALFCLSLGCHHVLSKHRPNSQFLTTYYLYISIGGALGGLFAALVAPIIFPNYSEYPLAALVCCAAFAWARNRKFERLDLIFGIVVLTASFGLAFGMQDGIAKGAWLTVLAVFLVLSILRPWSFAATTATGCLIVVVSQSLPAPGTIFRGRTFFGTRSVLALTEKGETEHLLMNGNTLHGSQRLNAPDEPTLYYAGKSGIALTMKALEKSPLRKSIGVVGLGVGTTANFSQPGGTVDFYEIDPQVIEIAWNKALFTNLSGAEGKVRVIAGDARLRLAEEPKGIYGILVLDAFSSDAIPIHLLTKEAFRIYADRLEPEGVILLHVSNRHLQLAPVISATVSTLGFQVHRDLRKTSDWLLVSKPGPTQSLILESAPSEWKWIDPSRVKRPWTDDFSDVLSAASWFGVNRS